MDNVFLTQRNAEVYAEERRGVEGWERWVWGMVKNDMRYKTNDFIILSKCEN
jgi:hypothetical protein